MTTALLVFVLAVAVRPAEKPAQAPAPTVDVYAPILMYHHIADTPPERWVVSPRVFTEQMQWLKDHDYRVVSLDDWYDTLQAGRTLPARAVVITFDDGWRDQQVNAVPVLVQFGYTATFYVITSCVGAPSYTTWGMLRRARTQGMTIGSHSVTHPILTRLAADDIERELTDSKATLERRLGISIRHFAYPDGVFTDAIVAAARAAGYQTSVTTGRAAYQRVHEARDYYTLSRVEADNDMPTLIQRLTPRR